LLGCPISEVRSYSERVAALFVAKLEFALIVSAPEFVRILSGAEGEREIKARIVEG
jgi:hypothetical protein